MATYTALVDVKVNTRKVNEAFKNIEGSLGSINKRSAQTNQRLQRMEATFNRVNKQLSSLNKTQINSIRAFSKMNKGASASADTIEKLQKQVKELKKQIDGSKKSLFSFGNIFKSLNKVYKENAYLIQSITAGLFGFIQYELIGGLRRMTDQFILMSSRLKVVNSNTKIFNQNLQAAFQIAQDTRQPLFQVANTMARIGRNSKALQKDLTGLHRITSTIGKSFQVAGATIEEANNAMIQLSQAFASGRLQGDELRSVLELAPRLAQGIAKQIGISVGSLRAFAKEGKLTTEVLRKAIQGASAEVDRDFGKIQKTIGQSLTLINNSIMNLVGNTDRATGANRAFADAFTRLSKAIDRLKGNKVILGVADFIKLLADNLELVLKVATTLVASGVITALFFSLKVLFGVLTGPAGLIFGTIATGVYMMLDAMSSVPAGVNKAAKSFTSIDDAIEESTRKIVRLRQELNNLSSDGPAVKSVKEFGSAWQEYVMPVLEKINSIELFPGLGAYVARLKKDAKKIFKGATGDGSVAVTGPVKDPDAYAKLLKKQADLDKELTIKSELERFQLRERLNKEQAKRDKEEAAARAAFLKTYEVELNAAKALNKERLKGVREELKFRAQQQNLFDTFGAAKYAGEVSAARSARERFTKILGRFDEAPGQFGQVVQGGRVNEDSLMQALKTPALEQRFKDEPAVLDALALEARKIVDDLNTDLIEAEERRLVEQKVLYFKYLDDISQQAKAVANEIALAQIGDPSSLSGGDLASYNKLKDEQAGQTAVDTARRSGIADEGQLENIREQTMLLNKQQRSLQHIIQLNKIRNQTDEIGYKAHAATADRLLERNIITGELTKKGKIQQLQNEEILGVAKALNISSDKLSVTKDGQIDLDTKGLELSKEEKDIGRELILQAQKRINIEKAAMPTGELDDPNSQRALQENVVGGVLKAGGQSAQRMVNAAQAYQAAGGGITGLINMIADLILSNKKVMEAIGKIFDAIMEPIDAILDPLGELISAVMMLNKPLQQVMKVIGKSLGSIVKMLTSIIHPFSQLLELLQPFLVILTAALQLLVQFINTLLGGIIESIITPIIEGIMDVFGMGTEEGYKPETLLQAEADILSDIETSLEGAADALKKINDVVFEITNSALNLLAPSIKLEDAKAKYNELKQLATTIGSDEYIDEFTSYAQTYLQQSQDVLRSSSAYQAIYDQVIGDLEDLQKLEFQGMSKNLTDEIRTAAFNLDLVGSDLGESIRKMIGKFEDGAVDFVDILTYVAYKQGQVASDLSLYEMAEFGGVDLEAEMERIKKARGTAASSSSLDEDLATLGIIGGSTTSSTINAQNVVINSQGRGTGRSTSSYSYIDENRQETFGDIGQTESYSTLDSDPLGGLFSGSFDLGELFANLGQMIIDGLIAALKSLGAAAADILAAVFGFIEDAFKGISNVAEQILGAVLGPILEGLGEVGNVAGQFLNALFSVFEGIAVNAGQFLTGIFMPILRIGAIAVDQFLSAVLYPITKAIESGLSAVGGIFQSMIVDPILNALGLNDIDTSGFTGIFDDVFSAYTDLFSNLDFGAYFDGLSGAISNMFDGITKIFQLDFDGAGESFTAAFESMWDGITGLFGIDMSFEEGMETAQEMFDQLFGVVTGMFDGLTDPFNDLDFSAYFDGLTGAFDGMFEGVKKLFVFDFEGAGESFTEAFESMWDGVTGLFGIDMSFSEGMDTAQDMFENVWETITGVFDFGDLNFGDFDITKTFTEVWENVTGAFDFGDAFQLGDFNLGDFDFGQTTQKLFEGIGDALALPTDFEFPDLGLDIGDLFDDISDALSLPTDFSFPDVGKALEGIFGEDMLPSIELPTDFEFPDIGKSIQQALTGAFSFGDSLSIDLDIGSSIQQFIDSAFSFTKGEPQDVKLLPNPLHQFDIGPDYFIKFKFGEGGEIPKFANGGMVRGPSHEQGGVLAELEGGEMVLSKNRVKQIEEARQKFGKFTSSNIDRAKARNKDGDCLGCMNFKVGGITPVKLYPAEIMFDSKTASHVYNSNPTYGSYTRPSNFDFGASNPVSPAGREIKDDYDVRSKALGKNMMKPKSATTGSSSLDDENVWSELFWSMLSLMAGFDTKTLGNSVQQIIASPNLSTAASVAIGTPLSLLMGSLFFNARSGFESAVDAVQGTNSGYTNMTKGGAGEQYGKATSKVNNPKGVPSYNDVEKYKSYATGGMTEKDAQKYSSFPHGTSDSPKNWDIGTRFRGGFRTGNTVLGNMALGVDADITDPMNWNAFAEWDCPNIEYDDRCKFMVDYGWFGGKQKVTTGYEQLDNGLGNILAISSFGRCDDNLVNVVKRNVPWLSWLPLSVETESTATMDFCDGLGKMGGAIVDGAKGLTEFADGLPTFASGGALGRMGGMAKGPSHKNGGIKGMVGGKQPIEFEGGEYIIKKETAQKLGTPFLDRLNQGAIFAEGGSFDPLSSSGGTSSTGGIVNREISLFNPITFDTLSSLNPDATIYEAFEDLEFYEVGFQEVGNELIDELQLLRQALSEGNIILETAVEEMSDRLKNAIEQMSLDIQGVIVFMEGELLKALQDIETAIKDIAPAFGEKFNELVDYFSTVITQSVVENSIAEAFTNYFDGGNIKDDFTEALREVFTFKDDALKIAIAGVDSKAGGGGFLKVRTEEMGQDWQIKHLENLMDHQFHKELADELAKSLAFTLGLGLVGGAIATALGLTGVGAAIFQALFTVAAPYIVEELSNMNFNPPEDIKESIVMLVTDIVLFPFRSLQKIWKYLSSRNWASGEDIMKSLQMIWDDIILFPLKALYKIYKYAMQQGFGDVVQHNGEQLLIILRTIISIPYNVFKVLADYITPKLPTEREIGEAILKVIRFIFIGQFEWYAKQFSDAAKAYGELSDRDKQMFLENVGHVALTYLTGGWYFVAAFLVEFHRQNKDKYEGSDLEKVVNQIVAGARQLVIDFVRNIILQPILGAYTFFKGFAEGLGQMQDEGMMKEKLNTFWNTAIRPLLSAPFVAIEQFFKKFYEIFFYDSGEDTAAYGKEMAVRVITGIGLIVAACFFPIPAAIVALVVGAASYIQENEEEVGRELSKALNALGDLFLDIISIPYQIFAAMFEGLKDLAGIQTDVGFDVNILGARAEVGNFDANGGLRLWFLPDLLRGDFDKAQMSGIWTAPPAVRNGTATPTKNENIAKLQTGGYLMGPSHENGGIAAMVGGTTPIEMEGGEYVISKKIVDALGVSFFDRINFSNPEKYREKGFVQTATVDEAPTKGFDLGFSLEKDLGDVGRLISAVIGDRGMVFNGGIADLFKGGPFGEFRLFREGGITKFNPGGKVEKIVAGTTDSLFNPMKSSLIPRTNFDTGLVYGHFGVDASATPVDIIPGINIDAQARERVSSVWDSIGNATGLWRQGGPVSNNYTTDPELAVLMSELIQTVKDKEMGVNIYNETGQNMRVSDGEGAGFNESSYRESSSLA